MRYVVLLYGDERVWDGADEQARTAIIDAHHRFSEVVDAHPQMSVHGGEALRTADTATTLRRVAGERVVTDGPFAESTEQLGGFYLVEAPDLDTLMTAMEQLPEYYVVEARPVDDTVPG